MTSITVWLLVLHTGIVAPYPFPDQSACEKVNAVQPMRAKCVQTYIMVTK